MRVLAWLFACGGVDPARSPVAADPPPLDTAAPTAPIDDPAPTPAPDPVPSPACTLGPRASPWQIELQHAGATRRARVDLPAGYDGSEPLPLVLNFHGLLMDADLQRVYTGMSAAASARGWIAVHPDAHQGSWNLLPGSPDPGFVAALLDAIEAEVCVDGDRVYATGLSNGGFFSYTLGCTLADRIAAIAPVAGSDSNVFCAPGRPVPLLHLHGTADFIVSYQGGLLYPSAPDAVADWASEVNDCAAEPVVTLDAPGVTCETRSCGPEDEATLCTLPGTGHVWPGADPIPLLPGSTDAIDANAAILDFFERF